MANVPANACCPAGVIATEASMGPVCVSSTQSPPAPVRSSEAAMSAPVSSARAWMKACPSAPAPIWQPHSWMSPPGASARPMAPSSAA